MIVPNSLHLEEPKYTGGFGKTALFHGKGSNRLRLVFLKMNYFH